MMDTLLTETIPAVKRIDFKAIIKNIATLSLPMAVSQFINFASAFLCSTMVAQLGQNVLAASALMISTHISLMVTSMSLLLALSVMIGHAYGAKNDKTIGIFFQHGWLLACCISIPVMILYFNIEKILLYFGQSPTLLALAHPYLHIMPLAVVPILLSGCNQQFGYGIKQQKLMIFISLLSVLVLLATAYALILGNFGMPRLGVAGLAYAQIAQNTFYLLVSNAYFYWDKRFKQYDLFTLRLHTNWRALLQIFQVGWPISLQMGGEMLAFFVSAILVGWLGAESLAAYQISNQYLFLVLVPMFALSQATGILVSHASGAKNYQEAKKLGNISLYLLLCICSLVAIIFLFMPYQLAAAYLDVQHTTNILHLVVSLFAVTAVLQLFDGARNVLTGALRGIFDTNFAMRMSLLVLWGIDMPLSYLLAFPLHYGVMGIAWGSTIGLVIGAIIMYGRWNFLIKKYNIPVSNAF